MDISQCMDETKLIGNAMEGVEIDTIAITKPFPLLEEAKYVYAHFSPVPSRHFQL